MFIKTVKIVHENLEVTYFYRENEASIFDAKILVNLCFDDSTSWVPPREIKAIPLFCIAHPYCA